MGFLKTAAIAVGGIIVLGRLGLVDIPALSINELKQLQNETSE